MLILIVLALAIVIVIYELIHRFLIRRAIIIMQRQAQQQTDRVVKIASEQILGQDLLTQSSKLVADVWGKGVLSFEYCIDLKEHDVSKKLNREEFGQKINEAAQAEGIFGFKQATEPFLVTDWWTFEEVFHVDVTYVMNEATSEYVHDLGKLNE